jgi:hypothetical protein
MAALNCLGGEMKQAIQQEATAPPGLEVLACLLRKCNMNHNIGLPLKIFALSQAHTCMSKLQEVGIIVVTQGGIPVSGAHQIVGSNGSVNILLFVPTNGSRVLQALYFWKKQYAVDFCRAFKMETRNILSILDPEPLLR